MCITFIIKQRRWNNLNTISWWKYIASINNHQKTPNHFDSVYKEQIHRLNNIATEGLKPDLTIVLDVDVETSQKRVGKEKDRMESAGIEFFERVRKGFLEIAKNEPERVKVIDSTQLIEEIHKQVLELVRNEFWWNKRTCRKKY